MTACPEQRRGPAQTVRQAHHPRQRRGAAQAARALLHAPAAAMILLARLYQVSLSPLLGRQCRFVPTCSNYFIEAVQKHGAWAGGWMGFRRILRCHPFSRGGHDPVP